MGEPHEFRLPFSAQSDAMSTDAPNSTSSQESSSTQGNETFFSSSNGKPLFGTPGQSSASSAQGNTIFGGSAFVKPTEGSFGSGKPSIFGGAAQLNNTQSINFHAAEANPNNAPPSFFSRPQYVFGGAPTKPEEVSPGPSSIFGGALGSSQTPKPTLFPNLTSHSNEPTSTTKSSIFGGTYSKKEEPSPASGTSMPSVSSDWTKHPLSSAVAESSKSSDSTSLFSSLKPSIFGSATGDSVSSSLSHRNVERPHLSSKNFDSREEHTFKLENARSAEADSIEDGGEDEPQESTRSTKIIRKRGIFGKAVADVSKTAGRNFPTDELRSLICSPVDGDLADISVFKEHFAQFGSARVTVNRERRYVIATFKTQEEATKAKEGNKYIQGVHYTMFWKNLPKARRKSGEVEKISSPDVKKKSVARSKMEIDRSVVEELEAISGIDYLIPDESSAKRKAGLDPDTRRRSRAKTSTLDAAMQEGNIVTQESEKGISSHNSRSEGSKGTKSRASKIVKEARGDEKSSIRLRIGLSDRKQTKNTEKSDEPKQETGEHSAPQTSSVPKTVMAELLEILKQQTITSDDKLRVLEARDKLMRLRRVKEYDISKASKTVGTCPDMCPEKERLLRQSRRQISQYEINPSKSNEMDPSLMVKQYSRSSADQEEPLPHELRPPAVLTMTMNYLMHGIMNLGDQPGENLGEWYHFLWDRLRGIRKEITQQELCDIDAVRLVEQCARFHIHCGARLVAEDMSVFDDRINTENLTKCLQTLKHMYHDLWINNSVTCPNEPEFVTYFLLLNLNNGTIMWEMEQLREEVLKSPEIGFAAAMYNNLSSNNYVRFFRLVKKASYLNSCLCIRYFYQVRAKAIGTYVKALAKIRTVQYPLGSLVEELGFENAERAAAFCEHHGLIVENGSLDFPCVILSQETFENPNFVLSPERAFKLVESKRMGSVGEVVNGGPLPPRLFESHVVHNSFDENGYMHKSAFYGKDQGVVDIDVKDGDGVEEADCNTNQAIQREIAPSLPSNKEDVKTSLPQTVTFGGFGNQKLVFPSTLPNSQLDSPATFGTQSAPTFKTVVPPFSNQSQSGRPKMVKFNSTFPGTSEHLRHNISTAFIEQATALIEQAELEEEKKAQAELEAAINEESERQFQDLLQSTVAETAAHIALMEWNAAEENYRTQERLRLEEQLRAQEEHKKRALDALVDRISSDSLLSLLQEEVAQLIVEIARESFVAEKELIEYVKIQSEESLSKLMDLVTKEICYDVALEELKASQELARQEAVHHRVKQVFHHWLQKARRSLHRKRVMEDFPAGVFPLSIKEHARRWGFSADVKANASEVCSKRDDKILDLPDLKAIPAFPQITFAELIAIQAVHRYDAVRAKLDMSPTDKLLYKLFISVPEDLQDPATNITDWWVRRSFKQNSTMLYDDVQRGVYRLVSGVKVTSEVAVYASLQMVRGHKVLENQTSLTSGTSSVLFTLSPASNIQESRSRLNILMKSIRKLPAVPLVIAVLSPSEPPLEGLKQLVLELELDQWLGQGVISDYQILHVDELFDIKYLSDRFNVAFNYMVMTWTPTPEFALVCLKNVLRGTFQMFYISIQFNYNSSEVYPKDIEDPNVIIGLCNEWLNYMCHEFVTSSNEARDLCGEEFWPFIHKGAFLPFLRNPRYEQLLQETIEAVCLPPLEWPPTSEEKLESLMTRYCSWLKLDDQKQTLRRLSCLNGLSWSEKVKTMPWVSLIEDWMEARIKYIETSNVFGTELLCLMRAQNVERLYTYPWWAQSKHIISYLESHGSGRECEMDVDQTVPSESFVGIEDDETVLDQMLTNPASSGLIQLQEVTDSVNELKSVNEFLLNRIRKAIEDDSEQSSTCEMSIHTGVEKRMENDVPASPHTNSLVNTAFVQQNLQSNVSISLPRAETANKESCSSLNNHLPKEDLPEKSARLEKVLGPSEKMDEIMASATQIVSSLNQKYKIFDSSSKMKRVTDLKLGCGKIDTCKTPLPSDKLYSSPFVEQSQRRIQERLSQSSSKKSSLMSEKPQHVNNDSDLDIISDEESTSSSVRSISSHSSPDRKSFKGSSDFKRDDYSDEKSSHHPNDSEGDFDYPDRRRRHQHSESDDSYSDDRSRRYRNESDTDDNASNRTSQHHSDSEGDYSARQKRILSADSEDGSAASDLESDGGSYVEEEVQTISSDESRASLSDPVIHQSNSEQPRLIHDSSPGNEGHELGSDFLSFNAGTVPQNGFVCEDYEPQDLLNLDSVHSHYEYHVKTVDEVRDESIFAQSSDIGVSHIEEVQNEVEVSNSDAMLASEGNDDIPSSQCKTSSEDNEQNVYEVEIDRSEDEECRESVDDHFDDSVQTSEDECESYSPQSFNPRQTIVQQGGAYNDEDSCNEMTACSEEEEYSCDEVVEEEGGVGAEEALDEAEEEEVETETEPEEDSDVCEVIDDD